MKKYKNLTPFKMCVLQNFPFIEEDFDALTNYELMCKLFETLKILGIEVKKIEEFLNDFDVQDAVNKKLDDMAESGLLAEIIAQYIQLHGVLSYNTVSEMKNAENITNGSIAKTLGFHNINDKGGSYYLIRNITTSDVINEKTIIKIENSDSLIAELIKQPEMYVTQFGSFGDGINDDTESIQFAIEYNTFGTVNFPSGTFIISSPLKTYVDNIKQCNIIMDKTTIIKSNDNIECIFELGGLGGDNSSVNNRLRLFKGGIIDATNCQYGIKINENAMGITIKDCEIQKFESYGIYIPIGSTSYSSDLLIDNCYINGKGTQTSVGIMIDRPDNKIINSRINGVNTCIKSNKGGIFVENVHGLGIGDFDGSIFYHQLSGAGNKIIGSYCDTLQTFIRNDGNGDVELSDSLYTSYKNNVDCKLFDIRNNRSKMIIKNNTITVPDSITKHKGVVFTNFDGQYSINPMNFILKDNLINNYERFEKGDLLLMTHETYQPFFFNSSNTLNTTTWLKLGYIISGYYYNDFDICVEGFHFNMNFKIEKYAQSYLTTRSSVKSNTSYGIGLGMKYVGNPNGYHVYELYIKQSSGNALKTDITIKQKNDTCPFIPASGVIVDPVYSSETMDNQYSN